MTARLAILALVLVTVAVLQTALFPLVTLAGFRPDLLLLVVVMVAAHDGPMAGARVGAAAGLLADLLAVEASAGLSLLVYAVVGHAVGVVRPYLAADSLTAPIVLAFASGVVATFAHGSLVTLLADVGVGAELVVTGALAVGLYNALLAPLAGPPLRSLLDRHPLRGVVAE